MVDKKLKKTNEDDKFFSQLDTQKGISMAMNLQLARLGIIGLACDAFVWNVWLKDLFPQKLFGSFIWYVLAPFLIQEFVVFLAYISSKVTEKLVSDSGKVYYYNGVLCAFVYAVFFESIMFFYRDFPVYWIFATCPMLIASMYRDIRWLINTFAFTLLCLFAVILIPADITIYRLPIAPPPIMMALEVVVIGVLVSAIAAAMHKRINYAIEHAAKVEATEQAKSDFFTKMSHEIRTPISAILGMDEMILREDISSDVAGYATNIKNAGQNLLYLVNDILDSSKLDAGKLEIVPTKYDLMSILSDCYNIVYLRSVEKGLELKVSNDPSVPKLLYGDEVRIRQVLTNILTNAIKYTKEGYVELNVKWKKLEGDNINLILSVRDTGVGISDKDIGKLFDKFERIDEERHKYIEGTGLGLSISKQFVEMMNGSITVESEVGHGSVFTVTIPQRVEGFVALGDFYKNINQKTHTVEKYQESFRAPNAKILVVDDVQMNIDVFKGLLKRTEIQIDTSLSGERAIELVKENKYDLIFLDHLMPELDGVETLERIKAIDTPNNNTPIIALTANVGADAKQEYSDYGFTDYLPKPVRGKLLEDFILKYLKNSNSMRREQSSNQENKDDGELKGFISKLDFLDTVMGLSCCGGDVSLYRSILSDYVKQRKSDALEELYQKKNLPEYRVVIHAVKSTSLSIGALELSEEAKRLEIAAKEGDEEYIRSNHPKCMARYGELIDKINSVLS